MTQENPFCGFCIMVVTQGLGGFTGLSFDRNDRNDHYAKFIKGIFVSMKKCSKCRNSRTLDEFYKDTKNKSGLDSWCVFCRREKARVYKLEHRDQTKEGILRWRKLNPDAAKKHNRTYRDKNSEKLKRKDRAYYSAHREERCEKSSAYQRNNPGKHLQNCRRHRALKSNAQGSYTVLEWEEKLKEYDGKCAYCHREGKMTRDHVIPLSRGGSNYISNIVPACHSCNASKRNLNLADWLQRKSSL